MNLLAVLAIFFLVLVSISLTTMEAAFYQAKRRNLRRIADGDSAELEKLTPYFEEPPSFLMPIHIGTYTAHVSMTVLLTVLLRDLISNWAMLLALVIMFAYLLIFRLTLPYALARREPERVLLTLIRPFHRYSRLLLPVTTLLRRRGVGAEGSEEETNGNGAPAPDGPNAEVPPPPLLAENESRIVDSIARFSKTQAREVMTPRLDITALPTSATVAEARKIFRESKYSRLIAYAETLDDITGVLHVRDLVSHDGPETDGIQSLVRPALVVPDSKKVVDLLREMQSKRLSISILVDEYGVTAGLVSIEDILEELVGEIKDEYDNETEPLIVTEGVINASARVSLEMLSEALHPGFEMPDGVDTVGGLAMSLFGHVPKAGEKIEHEGYAIEVLEATSKRVGRVRFSRSAVEVGS